MTTPIESQAQTKLVELPVAIEKDGVEIKMLELRKPNSGNLRGLTLGDVCEMQFDAGAALLPRISNLNERDVLNMPVENWAPLLTAIVSFFVHVEQ